MKKKLLAVLLIGAVIFGLSSCGSGQKKLTIMIYMIGSDLESKTGMATEDLNEIKESEISLRKANVVVCAGGTEKWRNETVSADNNTILELGRDGFTAVETWDPASMGESSTLSKFLSYCRDNYESEEYALILWDHGSGPVMGYGLDTLHDKDCLTLPEMRDALESSPFTGDNKLAWVGFDACLMSSAELACIWADHADYLVASQEVEPAFGWHYSFLRDAGKASTPDLMKSLTDSYLKTCEDYYAEKGYEGRDTTLACMDLSKTDALRKAVDKLFSAAAADIDKKYNRLAGRRVNTRALGRATTGSEYDIVDLNDTAEQLSTYYPEESEALQKALKAMIAENATNAEGLSGLSLFYPFFNKYYYENSWADAYDELDVFPEYSKYLKLYESIWLGSDKLSSAVSSAPKLTAPGEYTMQLTPEQVDSFASAKYYVMLNVGGEAFITVYTSSAVKLDERDNTLTAEFNGNVVYAVSDSGDYFQPVFSFIDSDGKTDHYAVNCTLQNMSFEKGLFLPDNQGKEFELTRGWFHLAVNREDGSVGMCSLLKRGEDEVIDEKSLYQGKEEELNTKGWSHYNFIYDVPHVVTRNDNGVVLPPDKWNAMDQYSYHEFSLENGVHFEYAPLEAGDYSIMIEITDTQGNTYCSEPEEIDSSSLAFRDEEIEKPSEINWEKGDSVNLLDKDGIKLDLVNIKDKYGYPIQTFELTNNTKKEVLVTTNNGLVIINGKIQNDLAFVEVRAKPGETSTKTLSLYSMEEDGSQQTHFNFGLVDEYGYLDKIDSLQFEVSAEYIDGDKMIWDREPFLIHYSDQTRPPLESDLDYNKNYKIPGHKRYTYPYMGARAEDQMLLDNDEVSIRLMYMGADKYGICGNLIQITSKSDYPLYIAAEGTVVNDVFVDGGGYYEIMPHMTKYAMVQTASEEAYEEFGIAGIGSISIPFRITGNRSLRNFGDGDINWCKVDLAEHADNAADFPEGSKVLYEEDGLKVSLLRCELQEVMLDGKEQTVPEWVLTIENDTSQDISLDMTDVTEDGEKRRHDGRDQRSRLGFTNVGAHQKRISRLTYSKEGGKTLEFRLLIKSFTGQKILKTADDIITLKATGN